jgi:flagellar hook assembly protein FlgD
MVLAYGTALQFSAITFPAMFDPGGGTGPALFAMNVTTFAGRAVTMKAEFMNLGSHSILRTITNASAPAGTETISWDGRSDAGEWVAPGSYLAQITATDSAGQTATIRPVITIRY